MKPLVLVKAAAAVGLVALLLFSPLGAQLALLFSPDRLEALLGAAGPLAPLLLIGLMAAAVVVSPLPSLPLDIAAGAAFGPLLGTVYAVTGALLGAVIAFTIARTLGRNVVESLVSGHINLCRACSDVLLLRVVFASRLLPVVSFDVVSYGAGLTAMSLRSFALATGLGMVPLTYLYVAFGSALVIRPALAVPGGVLLVLLFFLIPRWIERNDLLSLRKYFRHDGATEADG